LTQPAFTSTLSAATRAHLRVFGTASALFGSVVRGFRIFLIYIFFFDFRKINGRTKKFEKYTSAATAAVVSHGGGRRAPLAAGPRGTALGPCHPAPRRQAPTVVPPGGKAIFIFSNFSF
jgi:hypothetical protein